MTTAVATLPDDPPFCACGCGSPTRRAARGDRKRRIKRGDWSRFVRGHHNRCKTLRSAEERFWSKVTKTDGCWLWTAAVGVHGYGVFGLATGRIITAPRYVALAKYGDVPKGMDVCHTCDNKLCVNPDHLWLGTRRDNMRDAANKGRIKLPSRRTT